MQKAIEIIDRGRGLQLSTSRITIQDLVPYFQDGCSHAEIMRWIPVLTAEEIAVAEAYYREHRAELDEQDRRIRERAAQRKNPPDVEEILRRGGEKMAALREQFATKKLQERNGDRPGAVPAMRLNRVFFESRTSEGNRNQFALPA